MYISITRASVSSGLEEARRNVARVHEFMAAMPGFRWAMVLRSLEAPGQLAAVSMWLTQEQASDQEGAALGTAAESRGFDVSTARGSMTPASHVALVEWQVADEEASRFATRWNAVYHAIEDRIGSRLLRDLAAAGRYVGLHAVTGEAKLDRGVLTAPVSDTEGLSVTPQAVHAYEVLDLTGE